MALFCLNHSLQCSLIWSFDYHLSFVSLRGTLSLPYAEESVSWHIIFFRPHSSIVSHPSSFNFHISSMSIFAIFPFSISLEIFLLFFYSLLNSLTWCRRCLFQFYPASCLQSLVNVCDEFHWLWKYFNHHVFNNDILIPCFLTYIKILNGNLSKFNGHLLFFSLYLSLSACFSLCSHSVYVLGVHVMLSVHGNPCH